MHRIEDRGCTSRDQPPDQMMSHAAGLCWFLLGPSEAAPSLQPEVRSVCVEWTVTHFGLFYL